MDLQEILSGLWLIETEVKLYLSTLELGMTQVANIARFSGIKRTTLYGILERMEQKWILKKHVKNKVSYYEAVNPDDLYDILEKHLSHLKNKLPELRAMNNKFSHKPKIYYFEGVENVAELYKMEVKDTPELVRIFSSNVDRKQGEADKLRKIRNEIYSSLKKRAHMNVILNREPTQSEKTWEFFHPKTINSNALNLGISIKIYGNKTKFISMKKPLTGIVIENEDIANTMRSIFDYIYKPTEKKPLKKTKKSPL